MLKNKRDNLTKNDIKEIINKNLGLPKSFSDVFLSEPNLASCGIFH